MVTPVNFDYLASTEANGRALVDIAARNDLDSPVPTCPGWTLGDLLAHVSGANRWVSRCVSSGLTAQERILPPAPTGRDALLRWSEESLDELLATLSATPLANWCGRPFEALWGVSGGAARPRWKWRFIAMTPRTPST